MKAEGGGNKGKGVKRERDENKDGGVIEVVSDEEDINTLQVMRTACYPFQICDVKHI